MDQNTIFVTGYAKLPGGITASEMYKVIAVGVLIDRKTGEIEDIDCSLVTSVARSFVKQIMVGRSITDYDGIAAVIHDRYHGSAKKALLSALKLVHDKYLQMEENG